MRGVEYWIPKDAAEVTSAFARAMYVPAGHDLMQTKSLSTNYDGQKRHQKNLPFVTLHEVCLKSSTALG
jgi:hypothetical protein